MRFHELPYGQTRTVEVRPALDADFGTGLAPKTEAELLFSDATGDALLRVGQDGWHVDGVDVRAKLALSELRDRDLPRIAWILGTRPRAGVSESALVQVHEFPARQDWSDTIEIGVDEKIVESLGERLGHVMAVDEVARWLDDHLTLTSSNGPPCIFLTGGPDRGAQERRQFRLMGRGFAIDVTRDAEDRLLVSRVVAAKRGREAELSSAIEVVRAPVIFRDATIAGSFRGSAETQLDQLVARAGSYLGLWSEYNKLERASVARRARELGVLRYDSRQRLADGRWSFRIEDAARFERALDVLRGAEEITDLEAATSLPLELATDEEVTAGPDAAITRAERRPRTFVGAYAHRDVPRRLLFVQPQGGDDAVDPPERGLLFLSLSGDRTRLNRREEALARVVSAEAAMPQLGLILEDRPVPLRRRRMESPLSRGVRSVFGSDPTPRQIEALRVALNTPDIALIQGPPGTGKTKMIAALEVRLAELGEQLDLAGQTLLTSYQHDAVENAASKTIVFGLPAVKVGGRLGREPDDGVDRWRRERIDALRGDLAAIDEYPVNAALRRIRRLTAAYVAAPIDRREGLRVLDEVADISREFIPPRLLDRVAQLRMELSRSQRPIVGSADDEREALLRAIRALRTEPAGFGDDGPHNAARALRRLELAGLADDESSQLLRAAAEWDSADPPPFLHEIAALQGALVDRLTPEMSPGAPAVHGEVADLLIELTDELSRVARESAGGEAIALNEYLDDLDNDVEGVRSAVRAYTAVLAATCQQAVGSQMRVEKTEGTAFANVIVDEAARANPLDLLIPMARGRRRIILVGDHRQLPHILEPDVERQADRSIVEATRDALKQSLFERLFVQLRAREASDGVKATVTLDVQYRMHPALGNFVSATFYEPYGESFASGRPAEGFANDLPGYEGLVAAWVDIPLERGHESGGLSKRRTPEARWIAEEIDRLSRARPDLSFGVISFYSAQVDEILRAMEPLGLSERTDEGYYRVASPWLETRGADGQLRERLRVGTVDAFQGKEFDVVLLSVTRSNDIDPVDEKAARRKWGHIALENRMCVAMSRQQCLLVAVGDAGMLTGQAAREHVRGLVAFHQLCSGEFGAIVRG